MASEVGTQRRNSKNVLLRRVLRQKSGVLGAFLILLFLITAAFPGLFSSYDPLEMNKNHRLESSSAEISSAGWSSDPGFHCS
jgi:hypothetical protein